MASSIVASPVARRVALAHQVDLSQVLAGGRRIMKVDVLAHLARQQAPAAAPAASLNTLSAPEASPMVPHFSLKRDADVTALLAWLSAAEARSGVPLHLTDGLIKMVAAALRQHPQANAAWAGDRILLNVDVHIALGEGGSHDAPPTIIHHADRLGLTELARRRAGQAVPHPTADAPATFTLSDYSSSPADQFDPLVRPPQAAVLAVGRMVERVVPHSGVPRVRQHLTLCLGCDHRVLDGARAAQFLDAVVRRLTDPLTLLDD